MSNHSKNKLNYALKETTSCCLVSFFSRNDDNVTKLQRWS